MPMVDGGLARPTRPIFAIFEGGGAKGVAHVGALQAIQDNNLEIVGVAGTSAGALVAVLAAIGLEAADIMSVDDPDSTILARYGETPLTLLGESDWRGFSRLLRKGPRALKTAAIFGGVLNFLLAPRIMTSLVQGAQRRGHFSAGLIAGFVNRVIRDRLQNIRSEANLDWDVPELVTFADLARGWPTVVPLKIVVTDVDRGTLELCEAGSTPDVIVAEAVAASISIPIVFRPASIPSLRRGRFADGGMVSNLPVWVFSEEKLGFERERYDDPPVPIIGFSLGRQDTEETVDFSDDIPSYMLKLASAALQGSQGTAARFLDDVTIVELDTTLSLLDFDKSWEAYRDAREAGRASADRHLRFRLDVKPDRVQRELAAIRQATLDAINSKRTARGGPLVDQLRVNLISPYGERSLRVAASVSMEADADDRLLLDRRGRGAAEAYRAKGLRVFRLGEADEDRDLEFMTKYERALVRDSVRAVACVPIFEDLAAWGLDEAERPEPSGVLALDSDVDLASDFRDDDLTSILVSQSAVLYEAVSLEVGDGEEGGESRSFV
jgi:NTE family protein